MSDNAQQQFQDELNHIYATLNQHDVEQFYAGYQLWYTRQRITTLQEQIGSLRQRIGENTERLQQVRPPAVAFATLARLQAKGVNDIDLLDRMLERGEEWLDLTMQRLDYCEQLDFIHDNYAQWCENALEGAYDWIDSMRDTYADSTPRPAVTTEVDEARVEATEELLLQKFASEEEREEEASSIEITLKRSAVPLSPSVLATEEKPPEPGLQGSLEEEPVTVLETQEAGPPQGLPLHEPEMAFPVAANVEPDADTSLVSAEQAGEDEYVEFAPAVEAGTEEAGSPQGSDLSFPVQADMEADSSLLPGEQVDEREYLEFAPPTRFETEEARPAQEITVQESEILHPVETVAESDLSLTSNELTYEDEHIEFTLPSETSPQTEANADTELPPVPAEETPLQEHADYIPTGEASLPSEGIPTADTSSVPVDQITSPEHIESSPLSENFHLNIPAGTKLAAPPVPREEPIPSKVDTTHNPTDSQVSMVENRKLPAQEVKPQQRSSLWRRFLAIFWP